MMLAIVKCILQCHNIKQGAVQLGLDEKETEQARYNFPFNPTQRFFDMLVDIRAKIQQLPISVNYF